MKSGSWLVVVEEDAGLLRKVYSGPDRSKARERAGEELKRQKGEKSPLAVSVLRVSKALTLSVDHLAVSLPKSAF
jgi:hypothetical protein